MSKAKYSNITSKEDRQKNKLNKCSAKFSSKIPKLNHQYSLGVFVANFEQYSKNLSYLKYTKNILFIKRYKIEWSKVYNKFKSVKNEELIMTTIIIEIIITSVIMIIIIIIMIIMKTKYVKNIKSLK